MHMFSKLFYRSGQQAEGKRAVYKHTQLQTQTKKGKAGRQVKNIADAGIAIQARIHR